MTSAPWWAIIMAYLLGGGCWVDEQHTTTHTNRCTAY